jgi:hypothetical protein
MYSLLVDDKQKSAAAGVKKCVAERSLKHDLYRMTLQKKEDQYITQKLLRSYNHTISNVTQCRVGLSSYDDKRFILPDSIHTRAYGHFKNLE